MLAVRRSEPFSDPAWGFEIKWDGVRTVLSFDGSATVLRSRRGRDVTATYPEVATAPLPRPLILDGEIVALDPEGRPSFERLQRRMNLRSPAQIAAAATGVAIDYVVFDLLYDGGPVIAEPWVRRRSRLARLELPARFTHLPAVDEDPTALWDLVRSRGMEGIVAKRLESVYRPGERSADWQKIGLFRIARAVVGGFTTGEGGRSGAFGALLLGQWVAGGLRWVGAVGSSFSDASLVAIRAALDEMTVGTCPFVPRFGVPKATWVQPQLVAMVQYKEWTAAGRLRAPSFHGFTDDDPAAITWVAEGPDAPG
jgi:bifunctional non-homologous end joining protein LigD